MTSSALASRPVATAHQLAIDAQELVKTYPGGVRALDGVNLTVEAGSIFGLLGPNGAGKSTTVRVLTTLSTPDSGSARVAGYDVRREAGQVRRAIGVVGQKSGVDRAATGRENLVLQGQVFGMGGRDLGRRVDELLDRFDLTAAAKRAAGTFSGGMQRKLDIALGLIHRPSVLFLDEPTTGLDPEARADLWTEISRLAEGGLTVLLTTHYLEEADKLASRLAIVDRGRVVVEGTPDELKGDLQGDALQIALREVAAEDAVRRALDRVPGLAAITLDGRTIHARAADGASAVPAALAALDGAGLAVASVTAARPSLDDVYLRYAGRSFGEADSKGFNR